MSQSVFKVYYLTIRDLTCLLIRFFELELNIITLIYLEV